MRYFFEISYNGSNYNGWQTQNNATGIQAVVEDCFLKILRREVKIVASGRTDTGVHCKQQFFHADLDDQETIELPFRLNMMLPPDIVIQSMKQVSPDAHARYDAYERTYKYHIVLRKDPFSAGRAWYFFKTLDVQTMNAAAALLVGKHDFTSFSKVKTDVSTFVCEITTARWEQNDFTLEFTITANRFLRGMVRAIVGTLVDIGLGRTTLEDLKRIIDSKDRKEAGQNVPPYGLYLVAVKYPEHIFRD